MNRLASIPAFGRRAAALGIAFVPKDEGQARSALEELKLFATGWLGGLVFFGTFLA